MFIMNTDNPANPPLSFTVNDNALTKHLIAILDIIAANNWVRPVYFLSTQIPAELGLTDYLRQDGFAYRLVPERFEANGTINTGSIDAETLYDKLMNRFKWGNMNNSSVFIDYNCIRTANVLGIRNAFARLAEELINKGQDEKAVDVLDRCMELMPHRTVPYDFFVLRIVSAYMNAGAIEKARMISTEYRQILQQEMDYYASLKPYQVRSLVEEITYTQYVMERINAAHLQVQE